MLGCTSSLMLYKYLLCKTTSVVFSVVDEMFQFTWKFDRLSSNLSLRRPSGFVEQEAS